MSTDQRLFGSRPSHGELVTYCLPDAGSGAGVFAAWQRELPSSIEVRAVRLPGREDRISDRSPPSVTEIADGIMRHAQRRPYAVYGHSMGARLAFEVVRELRRRPEVAQPLALYVGAAVPPDAPVPLADVVDLDEDQLVTALITRAGASPELAEYEELRELVLPVIRSDLRWLRSYRYVPEPPLSVPIVAFAGADDAEDGRAMMLGWQRHCDGAFRLYEVQGGHAFHRAPPGELMHLLSAELLAVANGRPPPLRPPQPDEVHVFAVDGADEVLLGQFRQRYGEGSGVRLCLNRGSPTALVVATCERDTQPDRDTWRLRFERLTGVGVG